MQIGARNMQDFRPLSAVGNVQRPALLTRGLSGTTTKLLMAAECVLAQGHGEVMLCERGIRTDVTATRNRGAARGPPVFARRL